MDFCYTTTGTNTADVNWESIRAAAKAANARATGSDCLVMMREAFEQIKRQVPAEPSRPDAAFFGLELYPCDSPDDMLETVYRLQKQGRRVGVVATPTFAALWWAENLPLTMSPRRLP
jgi:hypothetical protein